MSYDADPIIGSQSQFGQRLARMDERDRRRMIIPSEDVKPIETSEGTALVVNFPEPAESSVAAGLTRAQIQTVRADYLETYRFNTAGDALDTASGLLIVAIPKFLRSATYNLLNLGGYSFTNTEGIRRVQSGLPASAYLLQGFFPPYEFGQEIYAMQCAGKTDVIVPAGIVVGTTEATRLEWIDANVEGRHLDTIQTQLQACRLEFGQPVTRTIVVQGGPAV